MFKVATFKLGKSFVLICGILVIIKVKFFLFLRFFYMFRVTIHYVCIYEIAIIIINKNNNNKRRF